MVRDFIPLHNYVLLKLVKVDDEKRASGLIMVGGKDRYDAIVDSIGPEAKGEFKAGDVVVFNEYDKKVIERNNITYILVQDKSVMAVAPEKIVNHVSFDQQN
jgi:co-chaperonin GroES (HSP10)